MRPDRVDPRPGQESVADHPCPPTLLRSDLLSHAAVTTWPDDGGSYGGWITSRAVGPCEGAPGTPGW